MAWSEEVQKEFQRMTIGEQNEHLFHLVDVMAEEMQKLMARVDGEFSQVEEGFDRVAGDMVNLNSSIHMALCNCQECSLAKEVYNLMEDDLPAEVDDLDD